MSRTTLRCFLALGISISLAAACGDDDGDDFGGGGSAGDAGSSGMPGNGGRGGDGGNGTSGSGGSMAGTGGTGDSNGGTGGSNGGTGGSNGGAGGDGGTGGDDVPDAGDGGPGDEPDASQGGTGGSGGGDPGDTCPVFATAALAIAEQQDQDVAIARVLFNADATATVVLRNVSDTPTDVFELSDNVNLCTDLGVCVSVVDACEEVVTGELVVNAEVDCTIVASEDEGEIALLNADIEENSPTTIAFAYIQWADDGDFTSPPAFPSDGGVSATLEDIAAESGANDDNKIWIAGETITIGANENTIVSEGSTVVPEDFATCTRTP